MWGRPLINYSLSLHSYRYHHLPDHQLYFHIIPLSRFFLEGVSVVLGVCLVPIVTFSGLPYIHYPPLLFDPILVKDVTERKKMDFWCDKIA